MNSLKEFIRIILPLTVYLVELKQACLTQTSHLMFSFLLDLSNNLRFVMSSQHSDVVNILKRRCEVLEEQLAQASEPKPKG
jgi:hypothetical protein